MTEPSHQSGLFSQPACQRHRLAESWIDEFPVAFTAEESTGYFSHLRSSIDWQSAIIRIAGRTIPIPRLQCWVGDPGLNYAYSGLRLEPRPWTPVLNQLRARVESLSGHEFNVVLLNLYRDGNDSVSWHADDEPELGPEPVIASVSFGASRPFDLKHRHRRDVHKVRMELHDGSLIVMSNTLQLNWMHQIPKVRSLTAPRINLTFRRIVG